jgi:antitoxin MazE
MSAGIRTRIVKIGNSQGVRIPKLLLEQSGLGGEVEIEVQGDHLTIRAAPHVRAGWDAAFAAMSEQHDDALLDSELLDQSSAWDQAEWHW